MATSKYSDIRKEKEQMTTDLFKKCGVFWAFSDKQFEENKTPLKEGEKYVSIGAGGYMPKGSFDAFREGMKAIDQLGKDKVKKGNLAETEILYELRNHECFYTSDYSDVVDMFKGTYTEKEISDVYNKHYDKESEKFKNGTTIKTIKGNKMKSREVLIKTIKTIISEYGGVTIGELGEESILLEKDKKDEEWMIEGFYENEVSVTKYVHGSDVADNDVPYEKLRTSILVEIYEMIKDYKGEQAKNGANIKGGNKFEKEVYDYYAEQTEYGNAPSVVYDEIEADVIEKFNLRDSEELHEILSKFPPLVKAENGANVKGEGKGISILRNLIDRNLFKDNADDSFDEAVDIVAEKDENGAYDCIQNLYENDLIRHTKEDDHLTEIEEYLDSKNKAENGANIGTTFTYEIGGL